MKTLVRIYSASCLIVVAFFAFFLIPWGLLPFSDAVNIMLVGAVILGLVAYYVLYFYRREGFEFGWFLANKGGFWAIVLGAIGFAALVCGTLLAIWPDLYVPAFEQGALPFGILTVSLFWLALIFMFGFITFGLLGNVVAHFKLRQFVDGFLLSLLAAFCLFLTAVFFSLFVEVINDIAIRIPSDYQWNATLIFAAFLAAIALVNGMRQRPENLIENDQSPSETS